MRFVRILITLFALVLLPAVASAAPFLICNTGQAVGCVGTVGDNVTDVNYSIISGPVGFTGATKAVLDDPFPIPPLVANDADSRWIGPGTADDDSNGPIGNYVYRTTFNLTGFDPSSASITGSWSTDNLGLDILINGVSTGQVLSSSTSYLALHAFSVTSGFINGINTLDFVVRNEGGPTALRVDNIAGSANVVPEPASLLLLGAGLIGVSRRLRRGK